MIQHPECKEWQVRGLPGSCPGEGDAPGRFPPADLCLCGSRRSSCVASPSSSSSWGTSSPPSASSTRSFRTRTKTRSGIEAGAAWGSGLFLPTGSISHPHLLDAVRTLVSRPIPWKPGCGTELGACSRIDRVFTAVLDPCPSHSPGVRSVLQLLSRLPSSSRRAGCLGQLLPSPLP